MRRRTIALALACAAALALAGCLGGGADDDASPASTTQEADEADVEDPGSNDTAEEPPTPSWENETRDGSFTGTYAGAPQFGLSYGAADEEWTVPDGVRNLTIELEADTPVRGYIYPPCDQTGVAGTPIMDGCPSHQVETQDGQATWGTDEPKPGDWSLVLYRDETGHGEVQYTVTIAHLLPPEG